MANFRWTPEATQAARDVADGQFSYAEIAEKAGVTYQTLYNWRQKPEFAARVQGHIDEYRETVRRRGLAILERRVDALNDRWDKMRRVIEARATANADDDHGGETGLIRRKFVGWQGKDEQKEAVFDYEFDAALVKELREHEKQAAQELGQWTEKKEIAGDDSRPVVVKVLKGVRFDDL